MNISNNLTTGITIFFAASYTASLVYSNYIIHKRINKLLGSVLNLNNRLSSLEEDMVQNNNVKYLFNCNVVKCQEENQEQQP
jgi:hypothetical protein